VSRALLRRVRVVGINSDRRNSRLEAEQFARTNDYRVLLRLSARRSVVVVGGDAIPSTTSTYLAFRARRSA